MRDTKIDVFQLYDEIYQHPGVGIMELAKIFDVPYRFVAQKLASLERDGLFVYEDDYNNLYPYTEEDK